MPHWDAARVTISLPPRNVHMLTDWSSMFRMDAGPPQLRSGCAGHLYLVGPIFPSSTGEAAMHVDKMLVIAGLIPLSTHSLDSPDASCLPQNMLLRAGTHAVILIALSFLGAIVYG